MKQVFMKIDRVTNTKDGLLISISAGCLRYTHKGEEIVLAEPLQFEMTHGGQFIDILRYIKFEVFRGQSPTGEIMQGSVYSIVAHENFEPALYRELRKCKVVPMMRLIDERELFVLEYEQSYEKLMGVEV